MSGIAQRVDIRKTKDRSSVPPGFLGVVVASTVLGNALPIKVENESIIIRLVLAGGKIVVGCASSAMRWARVGVEK